MCDVHTMTHALRLEHEHDASRADHARQLMLCTVLPAPWSSAEAVAGRRVAASLSAEPADHINLRFGQTGVSGNGTGKLAVHGGRKSRNSGKHIFMTA